MRSTIFASFLENALMSKLVYIMLSKLSAEGKSRDWSTGRSPQQFLLAVTLISWFIKWRPNNSYLEIGEWMENIKKVIILNLRWTSKTRESSNKALRLCCVILHRFYTVLVVVQERNRQIIFYSIYSEEFQLILIYALLSKSCKMVSIN